MSKNRYVNTEFWSDEYIENLSPLDKYLFLYCLTNPLANIAGIYKISLQRISFETGLKKTDLLKAFEGFKKDKKILFFNGWIACKNTIKHQKLNNNIKIGIETIINNAPVEIVEWVCETALLKEEERLYIDFERLLKPLNYINININDNINYNINDNKEIEAPKKSKKEKPKKIKYGDFVELTKDQFNKLSLKHPKDVNKIIEHFDVCKAAKGYKYKSDYHALLKWGIDSYFDDKNKKEKKNIPVWQQKNNELDKFYNEDLERANRANEKRRLEEEMILRQNRENDIF